ncbi:MAG: hypothetical protein ABSC37_06005 [Xanthobacteraceae bacterium]|jgi:hypothetical protein
MLKRATVIPIAAKRRAWNDGHPLRPAASHNVHNNVHPLIGMPTRATGDRRAAGRTKLGGANVPGLHGRNRKLGVDDRPRRSRAGGGMLSRDKIQVLFANASLYRLTVPPAAVEDTEKAAVFLYSKEKRRRSQRDSDGVLPGLMLRYNVTFSAQRQSATGVTCGATGRQRQ